MKRRMVVALALCGVLSGVAAVDPCQLEFHRLASRRFVLDNELPLAAYEPSRILAADVQHPTAAFDGALVQVSGWCPCAHYSVDIAEGAARLAFASPDGSACVAFEAVPGRLPAARGATLRAVGAVVPPPPFRFSVLASGNDFRLLATKDGVTTYLGQAKNASGADYREQARFGAVKFFADTETGRVVRASSALSAGIGQADVRFVTTGRNKRLYIENGRLFFTFSARGMGAKGVASFDPSRFDVRLEGAVLFDAGDGLFRGDGPADLFYDDVAGEWRAWVCNFSTVSSKDGTLSGRERGGVNFAWSKRSPLHGLSVMEERNLGLPGMNEDPTGFYDPAAGKWRVFLSEFVKGGIRGSLWESDNWNGPYARLTAPTKEDSTGQGLVQLDGRWWAFAGSADRACHVYTYPDLTLHGDIRFDFPPWSARCPNGRVWATLGVLPDGYPYRYVFLTMDRANFPGIPRPNWTYGALYLYGANDPDAGREASPRFISPADAPEKGRTAAVFERRFETAGVVTSAQWRVTGLGVFDIAVNGRPVGNDFLKPGYTECGKCRHEFSYDVLGLLKSGPGETNVLSATVTPGWWCDQLIVSKKPNPWQQGEKVAFRGELTLGMSDGRVARIPTDERWLAAYSGPLKSAGIYEGEVYDARASVSGLKPAVRNDEFRGEIRPAAAKVALRTDLTLRPVGALRGNLPPGELLVLDFGQNCSAVPEFTVEGASGTELEMRFAEMLNEPLGDPKRGNDGPGGTPYLANLRKAYAGLKYTLRDGVQTYRPSFTYYGYRYVGVRTSAPVVFRAFASIPVSSVTRTMECGRLVTGDARVNRLIENVRWGLLSNYLSIPTDCPQRDERFGWTADTQVFVDSASYLVDSYGFLMKYLDDLADTQRANGAFTYFAPNCRWRFDDRANAGWADAGVIIPYRLWKRYGRTDPFRRHWRGMLRYMDYLDRHGGHDNCENADWLSLEHLPKPGAMTQAEPYRRCLAAIYHLWDAAMMREMAVALGDAASASRFEKLERNLRAWFATNYLQTDGTMLDWLKGQTMDAFALKLGLCRDAQARELTRRDLISNLHAHGDCLQTGFLGTPILLPVLTKEAKAPDLAYTLLLQDKFPSWLYSVDQGATTIWERWNGYTKEKGFGPVSMNSFNHYAYGCVVEWLYAYAAGIRVEASAAGSRKLTLAPVTDRRLGSLEAEYDSPVGRVRSAWRYGSDGRLNWKFSVPEGVEANVVSPLDGTHRTYPAGTYEIAAP